MWFCQTHSNIQTSQLFIVAFKGLLAVTGAATSSVRINKPTSWVPIKVNDPWPCNSPGRSYIYFSLQASSWTVKQPTCKSQQHPELQQQLWLAFYNAGEYFQTDRVNNNSIIKTTHKTMYATSRACDQFFLALSSHFPWEESGPRLIYVKPQQMQTGVIMTRLTWGTSFIIH